MKIGNLKIDVDKDKEYTSEEIADIIIKEPGGLYFINILLDNNHYYGYIPIPMYPVKNLDNKSFHLEIIKECEDMDDFSRDFLTEISEKTFNIDENTNMNMFRSKYLNDVQVTLLELNENDYEINIFFDKNEKYDYQVEHFKKYLDIAKIKTFKRLREEVNEARKMFAESVEDSNFDIFDFSEPDIEILDISIRF